MQSKTDANLPHDSLTQEDSMPFFARFLEGQNNDHSQDDNNAGGDGNQNEFLLTLKYPSDRDEDGFR